MKARNSFIWIATPAEAYAERYLFEANSAAGFQTRFWDVAAGVTGLDGKPIREFDGATDPDAVLTIIADQEGTEDVPNRNVWVLRDLPAWITPPAGLITLRRLRNLVRPDGLSSAPLHSAQAIVVIAPSAEVPPELADHVHIIDWPLPDRTEIAAVLDDTIASLRQDLQAKAVNGSRDAVIDAAIGLSREEAQSTFAQSLVTSRRIDPAVVAAEKQRVIAKGGVLEFVKPIPGGLDAIGGLDNWKQWISSRADAYTPAARAYGLPAPKGALLVGVPGCGKSLSPKAIGAAWSVPVVRLDMAALKSKFVGESENNLRQAFAQIDAMGRVIVWIDEIEKALAGTTGDAGDGGVSSDALGALLSWMQDRTGEAFIIATANDASKLPPELLRKGRFDEIWWVDLPNPVERAGVAAAALRERGRDAETIGVDLAAVAEATDAFTGAEIAALVPDALFTAFAEDAREITTEDLLAAAKQVVPLAKTASEKIDKLREYWAGRARLASTKVVTATATTRRDTRALDI